jgi:hypothetical protein
LVTDTGFHIAAIDVVGTVNVSEKQGIKTTPLRGFSQVDPEFRIVESGDGTISGVLPLPLGLGGRTALGEYVDTNLIHHGFRPPHANALY